MPVMTPLRHKRHQLIKLLSITGLFGSAAEMPDYTYDTHKI